MGKIIRVKTWGEFKGLALALNPKSIIYNFHRAPLSKPPLCLRLTFASEQSQYVFLDFAQGDAFRETKIPIKMNRSEAYVEDEEIKDFLRKELGRTDLLILCRGLLYHLSPIETIPIASLNCSYSVFQFYPSPIETGFVSRR